MKATLNRFRHPILSSFCFYIIMNRNKTLLQRKTRVDISGQEIHTNKKSQLHELNLKLHTTK